MEGRNTRRICREHPRHTSVEPGPHFRLRVQHRVSQKLFFGSVVHELLIFLSCFFCFSWLSAVTAAPDSWMVHMIVFTERLETLQQPMGGGKFSGFER